MDDRNTGPGLAVVTGASSGIGYELARLMAEDGYALVLAADRPLDEAREGLEASGAQVETLEVDLATKEGVDALVARIGDRPVAILAANAGHGLGRGFLDQDFDEVLHVINTNVTGTVRLAQQVGRRMREAGEGRILFTGSIAGFMPGAFQAVYNASKAFLDSFSFALRNELKDSGVVVTCLMPGVTDTEFFERAGLMDTQVGQDDKKMHPAKVARIGYEALKRCDGDVVAGLKNKLQAAAAAVTPQTLLAERHRKMAEPGSGGEAP
ncbi:SDR family NAD(P)-dependent oxidoreductase [Brevundimonas lutea]|uniref:SDR family NAD(P)-dependent oxidoreductase n=1 Tax=Brevundimonas lutea TaxID=2293980 RepID=UPI000F03AF77|nr:SDR family NAD(P)-dependent oxidoreductase [Brevundimonas lutea]